MRRFCTPVKVAGALFFTSLFLFRLSVADPARPSSPAPTPVPNDFFSPGEAGHPVKLNFPFAWVGELKLPTKDEVNSRNKLEFLGDLSDQEIRGELEKWPPFNNMSLGDQGRMLVRIQEFKDRRSKLAQDEQQKLNLTNLSPSDEIAFKKVFWQMRRQIDDDLIADFQARYDAKQTELDHALVAKFSALVISPTPTPSKSPVKPPVKPTPTPPPTPPARPSLPPRKPTKVPSPTGH